MSRQQPFTVNADFALNYMIIERFLWCSTNVFKQFCITEMKSDDVNPESLCINEPPILFFCQYHSHCLNFTAYLYLILLIPLHFNLKTIKP